MRFLNCQRQSCQSFVEAFLKWERNFFLFIMSLDFHPKGTSPKRGAHPEGHLRLKFSRRINETQILQATRSDIC
jgi:hypothetical protein